MIKSIYCILISLIMLSCNSTKNTKQQVPDEHNSQNALDWNGIYRGTLPGADCEGILTTITLQKDMLYAVCRLRIQYVLPGLCPANRACFPEIVKS